MQASGDAGTSSITRITDGAYIGEVIVRSAGASWVTLPDDHPLGGSWPVVRSDDRLVNPIAKAFKRVQLGAGESIPYVYNALVAG